MSDYHEGLEEGIKIGKAEAAARIAELEKAVIQCRLLTKLMKPQADRIAELEAALEKQSAEIIRLRASIEKIARWYEDQAAYYEAQEQAFNRPLGDYGAAARFAQAKFQHRQQAAEIRAAALEGGKDVNSG